jgi:ribosomal protein L37AE/L43A
MLIKMNIKKSKYKCPRCHGESIIDYGEIIECVNCRLEFYKRSFETVKENNILAISELDDFVRIFMKN